MRIKIEYEEADKEFVSKQESVLSFECNQGKIYTNDCLDFLINEQESLKESVKMIYIDPPYNTGSTFVYNDKFKVDKSIKMSKKDRKELSHSNWLSFMYKRLVLARNLLKEDGVIFISIDDNEQANLKLLCDEVFGEENFVAELVWRKKAGGGQDSEYFAVEHEYILCYKKNNWDIVDEELDFEEKDFVKIINGKKAKLLKLEKWGNHSYRTDRPTLYYSIKDPEGNDFFPIAPDGKDGCWRKKPENLLKENIYWDKNLKGRLTPYEVLYYEDFQDKKRIKKQRSILYDIATTTDATKHLQELFDTKVFDYSKPYELISYLISLSSSAQNNDIILDFFAGSGTTGQAVMELNKADGGNRKFILVQIDEPVDERHIAYKHGFKTIDEITIARVKKVIEKNLTS